MDRTVLITGVTGQDGWYLSELCIREGWRVIGTARAVSRTGRAPASNSSGRVELLEWDMEQPGVIERILVQTRPSRVFNLAGVSTGSSMDEDPVGVGSINGLAVTRILEAMRRALPGARFCQASSREVFGNPVESPQTEQTRIRPRNPYGAAKAYADHMVRIYRERHAVFACSAILFNHESPKRREEFVSRKITHGAARIKLGLASELRLGNLDAQRDWGFAGDFVRAMWLMLQQPQPQDFVVATGITHSVREFCDLAFRRLGLDYRKHVIEDRNLARPAEEVALVGNAARAAKCLGWQPEVSFADLVAMMVDADMERLQRTSRESGMTE